MFTALTKVTLHGIIHICLLPIYNNLVTGTVLTNGIMLAPLRLFLKFLFHGERGRERGRGGGEVGMLKVSAAYESIRICAFILKWLCYIVN